MHRIQGRTGLRAAVIALGLVAWTATGATASPLSSTSGQVTPTTLSYTTSGQVTPTTGVTGTNVVSFNALSTGNSVDLSTGQTNASLGSFAIAPLAPGVSTTYNQTPFQISLLPASYGSTTFGTDAPVISLTGFLNGTVGGPSNSTVTATFNSVSPSSISLGTGNGSATFSLPSSILLAPSTSNGGQTSAQGLVTSSSTGSEAPVPEPSTIALFLTTVGGLGLRRYVLSRRRSARV